MKPEKLWKLSTSLYRRGWRGPAHALKIVNYVAFKAVLPYEVILGENVKLWHRGIGVVIHPNVKIGNNVQIGHGVTVQGTSAGPMVIGDGVKIGASALILTRASKPIHIGGGAVIGAGSVVVGDVAAETVVAGNPARLLRTA
jgi:serine O-acetyltransferase